MCKKTLIWVNNDKVIDQYVEFRREFYLDDLHENAELKISVDTNFSAYINGQFVGTGQYSDFPKNKTFSRIDIVDKLIPGKNVLCVLVHYCGQNHFSYIPGQAGLWFILTIADNIFYSDKKTLARISPSYTQNKQIRISSQMGFTFEYNAFLNDDWTTLNYSMSDDWESAIPISNIMLPEERPLPSLSLKNRTVLNIIAQGVLKRNTANPNATVAELMQTDFLSSRRDTELFDSNGVFLYNDLKPANADGFYVVVDMKREECGFINLELEANPGTIIDIAVGEHLADLRVRASTGGRNFASRYISTGGKQNFTHFINRYSGRYIQLHFTNISSNIILHYAGLIPAEYPLDMRGEFSCSDSLFNKIYDVSCRTLHLCMHEHYEDTPWREQALYANDSRNQALTGYYAFGEYDMPRVSFDMLSKTFKDDGYQELCAPMQFDFTIPSFTMVWFLATRDYILFSGDISAAQKQLSQIIRMMDIHLKTLVNDLLPSPKGKSYWHFYDWADGLSGHNLSRKEGGGLKGQRFDAPLNLFFVMALQAIVEISEICNDKTSMTRYKQQANRTAYAINNKFWVESKKLYQTYIGEQAINNHFAELTQALAILANITEKHNIHILQKKLLLHNNNLVATTLSQSLYKFEAILSTGEKFARDVFEKINNDWGDMLYNGATSFWETLKGQADFAYAGSLCHGWSAIPAYFFQKYLLGVKPLTPAFKTFQVTPLLSVVESASGVVPTPYGKIKISWRQIGNKYEGKITHPEGIELVLSKENININWTIIEESDK
jgi:hypothetical protein